MKETAPIDICCREEIKIGNQLSLTILPCKIAIGRQTLAVGVFNGGQVLLRAIHEQFFNLTHWDQDTLSRRPTPPLLDLETYLADDHPGLLFIPGKFLNDRSGGDSVQRSAIQGQILKYGLRRG
jgi:hypothetical protein